ncbi:NAD(P)-dependent dehydrogenase (short-subunit alcohol dehydrogenase family) [Neobacillus niacini]|uniref:SDR family oxidoreductase n=1 Tax=Neobacillus niacini TaxID=86668 RepID=UPI0027815ED6|nr:SDR family oxidoreductase [Neobacillus niacini]MDQ1002754.1 NAD(P)-dependent dehydrogenase (short-subunit alcohol dehydrogenase family) [Neobacillus niacini]
MVIQSSRKTVKEMQKKLKSISDLNGGAKLGDDCVGRTGPAYAASKGGIIALTKWAAREIGEYNITCNSVAPGATETAITRGGPYDTSHQSINRMGQPAEICISCKLSSFKRC